MANPQHVAVVLKGKDAIAEWRKANPGVRLDLSGASLAGVNLSGADLQDASMEAIDLREAILGGAKLSGSFLGDARLTGANLVGARLIGAVVYNGDLAAAKLPRADCTGAFLARANLRDADLGECSLLTANLFWADVRGASLAGADLFAANLTSADLRHSNLSKARLSATSLGHLDLSQTVGLATVDHTSPSSVGVDTLIASFRGAGNKLTPDLEAFFRGAGVPPELLDALPRLVAEVKYHSCFISYGQPDVAFATKLREDLVAKGVSCWLYEMDKTVGERTWHEIEEKLEEYDKMVVVCSIEALMREGVKKEIDKQIDKNPEKLIPVSLDNRWTQPGFAVEWAGRDLKAFLLGRNYADFANLPHDQALERLLNGLRRHPG